MQLKKSLLFFNNYLLPSCVEHENQIKFYSIDKTETIIL